MTEKDVQNRGYFATIKGKKVHVIFVC